MRRQHYSLESIFEYPLNMLDQRIFSRHSKPGQPFMIDYEYCDGA